MDGDDVLLPKLYVKPHMKIGDIIEVFIYTDSEDRYVATTLKPYAMVNEFAVLKVVDSVKFGAFMQWGLPKDLFAPKTQQRREFKVGEKRLVRILEDEKTSRLYATEKFDDFIEEDSSILKKNDKVKLLVSYKTPLGFKVLINNAHHGMIFKDEIFEDIAMGQYIDGYIKQVREDGKIDASIQPIGKGKSSDVNTVRILDILKHNGGKMNFSSKSDAKDIEKTFSMSKKSFKTSLTLLVKQNKIHTQTNEILLNK
jgi:predicted RNA-binding protein (virulence factor B family)